MNLDFIEAAIGYTIFIALLLVLANAFDAVWLAWISLPVLLLHIATISFVTFYVVMNEGFGLGLHLRAAQILGFLWVGIFVFCYETYSLLFAG